MTFTVITPYVFEEEIKELKSNIPWELDWILEQDNSRIGPDMLYQRLWKQCDTDIFIYPNYVFKSVDALITNFHLPKSTLLMLVSALATPELIFSAYQNAIDQEYRFYSYGDAMLIR